MQLRLGIALWLAAAVLGCSREAPLNLVLVTVDTLRADHLGAYGSGLELTPNLDELAAESVVFERAYAPTSYTLPSLVGLMMNWAPLRRRSRVSQG